MAFSPIPYGRKQPQDRGANIKIILKEHAYLVPIILVFAFLVVVYLGSFAWRKQLERQNLDIQTQKETILALSNTPSTRTVRSFARRVQNLEKIIDNRKLPSVLFSEFENSIHNNTLVRRFTLNANTSVLTLDGAVPNFEILGQQFVIWNERSDFVATVELKNFAKTSEGQIDFSADITIKDGYLK